MVLAPVKCPHCGSDNVKKNGTAPKGKQRFLCRGAISALRLSRVIMRRLTCATVPLKV